MTFSEAAMIMMSGGGGGGTSYDPTDLFTKGTPEFVIGPFDVGNNTYSIKIFKASTVSYDEYESRYAKNSNAYWPSLGAKVTATGLLRALYMEDALLWGNTLPIYHDTHKTYYTPTDSAVAFSSLYKDYYIEDEYTQMSYDSDRELTGYGSGVYVPVKYYHKEIYTYYSPETGEATRYSNRSTWEEITMYLPRFDYDCVSPFSGDELVDAQEIVNRDEWLLYNQLNPDRYLPYP